VSVFYSRRERDAARERAIASAREYGLADPEDAFQPSKTSRSVDLLYRLESRGLLLANGIDLPEGYPDHVWGEVVIDGEK